MNRPRIVVLSAAAVLALLAGTLGVRLLARESRIPSTPPPPRMARNTLPPPAATVPAPKAIAGLEVPCWGCPQKADGWPVRFQTDLDVLAPLGDGSANAAIWLKDFARQVGAREDEVERAVGPKGRATVHPDLGKVLAPDDPLLLEAEPWADQATMRFYPDIYPLEGFQTRIPNLLFSLTLAKSWVARARQHPDDPSALEDCRRAIRWGRLLRQEDVTLIQDLIGLACIRAGAQGLYDLASRRGDQPLMLASAIVLGEHAPQRLRSAQLTTRTAVSPGEDIGDEKVDAILGEAKTSLNRRFRLEAMTQAAVVRSLGSRAQRAKVETALDELAAAPDPLVASMARWARTTELDRESLASVLGL